MSVGQQNHGVPRGGVCQNKNRRGEPSSAGMNSSKQAGPSGHQPSLQTRYAEPSPRIDPSIGTGSDFPIFHFHPDRFQDLTERLHRNVGTVPCRSLRSPFRYPFRRDQDVHEGIGTQKPLPTAPPATFNGPGDFLRISQVPAKYVDNVLLQGALPSPLRGHIAPALTRRGESAWESEFSRWFFPP